MEQTISLPTFTFGDVFVNSSGTEGNLENILSYILDKICYAYTNFLLLFKTHRSTLIEVIRINVFSSRLKNRIFGSKTTVVNNLFKVRQPIKDVYSMLT